METKKSAMASLEKEKTLFTEIGFVISLALCLVAFEWSSMPSDSEFLPEIQSDRTVEIIIPVIRQPVKPPPPPPRPIEVINILKDSKVILEEPYFGEIEIGGGEAICYFPPVSDEPPVESTFRIVEEMPLFQGGGLDKFSKYIAQNLRYPPIAAANGVSGRVFVQFTVNASGEVVDVTVVGNADPALEKEAIRVVKSSPGWTPGKQRGRAVKVQFTFPIVFSLNQ
jgi:periplasmic protein TonB